MAITHCISVLISAATLAHDAWEQRVAHRASCSRLTMEMWRFLQAFKSLQCLYARACYVPRPLAEPPGLVYIARRARVDLHCLIYFVNCWFTEQQICPLRLPSLVDIRSSTCPSYCILISKFTWMSIANAEALTRKHGQIRNAKCLMITAEMQVCEEIPTPELIPCVYIAAR
jgi:hypothetical protein